MGARGEAIARLDDALVAAEALLVAHYDPDDPENQSLCWHHPVSDGQLFQLFTAAKAWRDSLRAIQAAGLILDEDDPAHVHADRCCAQHDYHATPHVGCILR